MITFNIGDVCKIKQWHDMVLEFGTVEHMPDTINVHGFFTKEMRHLCGQTFTIKSEDGEWLSSYEGIEREMTAPDGYWRISEDMLEPADRQPDKEIKAASKKQLDTLLGR